MTVYICVVSLEGCFDIQGMIDDETYWLKNFLHCFKRNIDVENKTIEFSCLQNKNQEIIDNIREFIKIYGKDMKYDSKKFKEFFDRMEESEPFYVVPMNKQLTQDEINGIVKELEDTLPEEKKNSRQYIKGIINSLTDIYDVRHVFTEKMSESVGEQDKNKRICRFCGKSNPEASFGSDAHAISHALGNYHIKLNEECDSCNNYFSGLEEQFINYFQVYKLTHGIFNVGDKINDERKIGENKYAKFTYKVLPPKDEKSSFNIDIRATKQFFDQSVDPPKITYPIVSVVPQNIYKTLCKYAISVIIEKEQLDKFTDTIQWVRGNKNIESLPFVGITTEDLFFKKPDLMILIRKDDNNKFLKSVAIFTVQQVSFLYTLPTDEIVTEDQFNNFLERSNIFDKVEWKWESLSSTETKKYNFSINFEQK